MSCEYIDTMYCIYSYSTTVGKAKLSEDESPQWRRMAWSNDSQVLAVSFSTGMVTIFDILCGEFLSLNKVICDTLYVILNLLVTLILTYNL